MPHASTLIRTAKLLTLSAMAAATTSCVPLLVGAAVGYIARDEGVGVPRPSDSGGSYAAPAYEDQTGGYDEPVY